MPIVCPQCGTTNPDNAQYCKKCGRLLTSSDNSQNKSSTAYSANYSAPPQKGSKAAYSQNTQEHKKFIRCADDQIIAGVCSGLAKYSHMDVNLLRFLTVLAIIFSGSIVLWVYLAAWVFLPEGVCSN